MLNKRLNIENFTLIHGKDTANFSIFDAEVKQDLYEFRFKFRDGRTSNCGEVVINRNEGRVPNTFYLEVRWNSITNIIYFEDVMHGVFGKKAEFFAKLDEIIMEKLKNKNI